MAGEQGHYAPAPMGLRDFIVPPPGKYFVNYDVYYGADKFRDSSGDSLDSLSVSGSRTVNINGLHNSIPVTITGNLTVDLDLKVDSYTWSPAFVWVTDKKFLGGDYGFLVSPSVGYMNVHVKASANASGTLSVGGISKPFSAGSSAKVDDSETGFGDLMVQPLWLGWHGKHYDAAFNYAFYAPTGYYDKDNIANIGTGFFTNRLQASYYFYPVESQATALMITPTYEWHSKKIDKDVQPGQDITLEYGITQYLSERLEVGVSAYNQWQITDDRGSAALNKGTHDSVAGVGSQITYWVLKGKCAVTGKYMQEYQAKDRLQGMYGVLNVTWIF